MHSQKYELSYVHFNFSQGLVKIYSCSLNNEGKWLLSNLYFVLFRKGNVLKCKTWKLPSFAKFCCASDEFFLIFLWGSLHLDAIFNLPSQKTWIFYVKFSIFKSFWPFFIPLTQKTLGSYTLFWERYIFRYNKAPAYFVLLPRYIHTGI